MHHRNPARAEKPIERIFREETGRKMPISLKSILLHKPMAERDPHLRLVPAEPRMPDEWIKTLVDGRRVKFTIQEMPGDRVFMTAQIEGNKVVYSIILTTVKDPLSRGDVERHFEGEVFRK